jgi:GT2 family glycosyltransferase
LPRGLETATTLRLDPLSNTAPQTRHTVTAVVVAHDGAELLPGLVAALRAQTYPVDRFVAVDTGSRDRSGAVLAELIGQDAVFGMERDTGFGAAVATALKHGSASRALQTDPDMRRVEWIWLLHDDCEPAPETLERLLRAASRDRSVVILGPKVLDGSDRRTLRETGVSIDRAGRRATGIEPGEIDQGQHDGNRSVLAVGSAGMLIRRDAWDQLGGFDTRLTMFRDDLDFCWRAQGAGFRVQVITDAVLYHRELSARRRRTKEGSHPRTLDRRNALYVLAVNLPLLTMLRVLTGCVAGSLVRAAWFLLTKQTDLAAAQMYAVASLLGNPVGVWQGRRRRAATRREAYEAVRVFIAPGRTLTRLAEGIAGALSSGPPQASGGRHQAISEPGDEEDEQFVDTQSVLRRIIGNPGMQLFVVLLVVALIAERRLLGTSPLGGGALVPAWGSASQLWAEYVAGFHATGVGSAASAPPYVAVVAALASVLGGQSWLAVAVLLLGCVPLAGLTAYAATRRLVSSAAARVLLAASYALLPVAMGAVAAGRLGTAFAFVMLPLIALCGGRMLTGAPRVARRAAWATALLVSLAAAFAPVVWVIAAVLVIVAVIVRRWAWPVTLRNAAIVVVTPFILLFPWSLHLLSAPAAFFTEAGVQSGGLTAAGGLSASSLLMLSPGGPGLPPAWVTAGIVLAVVAALLPHRRGALVATGWAIAGVGFAFAIVTDRTTVTPAGGGPGTTGWPGAVLAVAAVGLLIAAAPAAEWLAPSSRKAAGARTLLGRVALLAAGTAPVLAAAFWVAGGVRGPVSNVSAPVLPAFVAASSSGAGQYRTLVLRPSGSGGLNFAVLRQRDPILGEPELTGYAPAEAALSREVAALGAPDGADAGEPGSMLGEFGIRWVMLPGPESPTLVDQLNAAVGLVPVSNSPSYDLWQVAGTVGRVRVIAPDGTVSVLASQQVGVSGASVPASGGTVVLAEPYGGWTATVNGAALKPLARPVDGWAQGFVLPAGQGTLTITRDNSARDLSLVLELVALLAVCVLALPGKRTDPAEDAEAIAAVSAAQRGRRAARSAKARQVTRAAAAHVGRRDAPAVSAEPAEPALSAVAAEPESLATEDSSSRVTRVTRAGRAARAGRGSRAGRGGRHGMPEVPEVPEVTELPEEVPGALLTDEAEPPRHTGPLDQAESLYQTGPLGQAEPPYQTGPLDQAGRPEQAEPPRHTGPLGPAEPAPWEISSPPAELTQAISALDGETPAQPERPERHSHRASRHSKPAKPAKPAKGALKQAKPGRRRRGSGES